MKLKNFVLGFILGLVLIATVISALAYSPEDAVNSGDLLNLSVTQVKLNGDVIENGDTIKTLIERGEDLELKVELISTSEQRNIEVRAMITGDDHHKIEEESEVFDMGANERKIITLHLELPADLEQDEYSLRVMVTDRIGQVKIYNYNLKIITPKHNIKIEDIIISPMYRIETGKSLFATVRLKNAGLKKEESVKVTVSVPELDIGASTIVDEIDAEDKVTTEEMWLGRIPKCAEEGEYNLIVNVDYNEGQNSVQETRKIRIYDSGVCEEETETEEEQAPKNLAINIFAVSKDIAQGESNTYPIVITNPNDKDITVALTVSGLKGWAIGEVKPSPVIVVPAGATKSLQLVVTANKDAAIGSKTINLNFNSELGAQTGKIDVNVVKSSSGMKTGLQIALIVLVVLLFVLGLIIGLSRTKPKETSEEGEEEYY